MKEHERLILLALLAEIELDRYQREMKEPDYIYGSDDVVRFIRCKLSDVS